MTNKVQSNTQTVLKRTNVESFQVWIVKNNTKQNRTVPSWLCADRANLSILIIIIINKQ